MAMMSRESTDKDVTLTEEQLRGIWAAAQCSPRSEGAPSDPSQGGMETTPTANTVADTPVPWNRFDGNHADLGGEARDGALAQAANHAVVRGSESSLPSLTEEIGVDTSWFDPSPDPGPSTRPAQQLHTGLSYGQPSPPCQISPGRVAHTATSVQSWHNLLYQ